METLTTSSRIYKFEDFIFDIYKSKLIRRATPSSPLELRRSKTMIVALTVLIILTIGQVMKLVFIFRNSEFDFTEFSAICDVGSMFVMTFGRGISLFLNNSTINQMLSTLEKLFPGTGEDQQTYHLESYAKRIIYSNKTMQVLITASSIAYLFIAISQSMFGVLVLGESFAFRYPFVCWYPFDEKRWIFYPFIYAFHSLVGICTGIFYYYEEFLFTTCVLQLCMHYRHLCELLSAMDATQVRNIGKDLGRHIRYQYVLEGLHDQINESFSRSTFFGFTIIKISICMFFFSTVSGHGSLADLPLFMCVITLVVPVYLRCKAGTILSDANEAILGAVYNQNWYEGTVAYRKAITIMLIRANRPNVLRASQLRKICMEYFKEDGNCVDSLRFCL